MADYKLPCEAQQAIYKSVNNNYQQRLGPRNCLQSRQRDTGNNKPHAPTHTCQTFSLAAWLTVLLSLPLSVCLKKMHTYIYTETIHYVLLIKWLQFSSILKIACRSDRHRSSISLSLLNYVTRVLLRDHDFNVLRGILQENLVQTSRHNITLERY